MEADPLVEEVRQARHRISQECGHDIWKLYAHYEATQRTMRSSGTAHFITSPLAATDAREPTVTAE